MSPRNQTLTLATLLTAFATAAIAEDDPVARLINPDSSVSIGIGHLSGDREQFGVFDDLRDSDTLLLLDADVNKRDDDTGTWMTLKVRNLGIDNRAIELGYERQGNWGVGLDYNEIPYIAPYTVNSGIIGLGTKTQSVPATRFPADPAGYVVGTGVDHELDTKRKRVGLNFFKYLHPDLNFKVSFRNEEKNGERHWGRGGAAEFAAEPIDSTTQTVDAVLNYAGETLQLAGGYIGNWYKNHEDLVAASKGATTFYLSQPLDNQAHQLFLNGGYSFTPATRGTFRLSYTHATVDENLPTAAIPGLPWDGVGPRPFPAAPSDLDAAIDTTTIFLGLSSRPMKNLSLVANLRYHEVNENTPADLIVCSRCDDLDLTNDQIVHSTPLDYKTLSGKLEGTYRLPEGYSVIAGVDIKNQDRTIPRGIDDDGDGFDDERYVPFRADVDETTYRVQLRKSMSETINGALALSHSKRDGSRSYPAVESLPGQGITSASINPINIANRDRNKLRATVDWAPTDRANLQFTYETARDDYSGQTLGLRDGKAQLISVDADYTVNEDWQVTGWVSHDMTEAKQHNHRFASGGTSEAEMFDTLEDIGDSVGLGIEGKMNPKIKVGANLEWTRTRSEYDQDLVTTGAGTLYPTGTLGPLPDIKSTAAKLDLFAEYAVAKNTDLRFDIVHERWRTDDWTWEFSDGTSFIYGTTGDGTKVIQDSHQSSTFVGVRYIYRFM